MNKIYLRYFKSKFDTIPVNSEVVCSTMHGDDYATNEVSAYAENVIDWLIKNPSGKVDFVIL